MSRQRFLILAIGILLVTNVTTGGILLKSWKTNRIWEEQMPSWVGYSAVVRASTDFEHGRMRIFELSKLEMSKGGSQQEFTGRHDGPFEIWTKAYFPVFSPPDRLNQEQFIKTYNVRMRTMHANPERFKSPEQDALQ